MTISDLARRARIHAGLAVLALWGGSVAQAATLKIATLSPEGSAWMELLRAGGDEVSARTGGRVEFKFYPGGVMGDDKAVLRKIRLGQLHGAVLTSSGLVQTYTDIQLYGLPLLFESYEEVDAVRAELDQVLIDGLRAQGFTSFGFADVGFARAMSKVPVTTVAEVQTQKVWTPDGDPGSARALESFGVTPIPLSIADVLGGLQTGLINGVAVPPVAAIALQWHTQLDYVMDLPLLYVYGMLAMANRPFDRLSEADQAVVSEVMAGVVDQVNARARADDANALQALYGQGLKRTAPGEEALDEWRAYAARANREMVEDGLVSGELLARLQALVEAHRAAVD